MRLHSRRGQSAQGSACISPRAGFCQTNLFLEVRFVFVVLKLLRCEVGALDRYQCQELMSARELLPILSGVVQEESH